MSKGQLFEVQIADGKRLVDRLAEVGIRVTAAGWVKESENGRWCLYIATSLVRRGGDSGEVYLRIRAVIREFPQPFWAGEVRLVEGSGQFARAVQELHQRPVSPSTILLEEEYFGGMYIEAAWIYPQRAVSRPSRKGDPKRLLDGT
jgi:hypothetical protein